MEKNLSPEEIQLELLKIAKADNKRLKSIKNNLQFIAWYLIALIILGVLFLIPILNK